jgi:hypothetical protein
MYQPEDWQYDSGPLIEEKSYTWMNCASISDFIQRIRVLRTSLKANAWYVVIDAVTERMADFDRVMILVLLYSLPRRVGSRRDVGRHWRQPGTVPFVPKHESLHGDRTRHLPPGVTHVLLHVAQNPSTLILCKRLNGFVLRLPCAPSHKNIQQVSRRLGPRQ